MFFWGFRSAIRGKEENLVMLFAWGLKLQQKAGVRGTRASKNWRKTKRFSQTINSSSRERVLRGMVLNCACLQIIAFWLFRLSCELHEKKMWLSSQNFPSQISRFQRENECCRYKLQCRSKHHGSYWKTMEII
jgi:hypothetical protein